MVVTKKQNHRNIRNYLIVGLIIFYHAIVITSLQLHFSATRIRLNGSKSLLTMASTEPRRGPGREISPTKREYRSVSPIPCSGVYTTPDGSRRVSCAFLGLPKMKVESLDNGEGMLVSDIIPVPLREDLPLALAAAGIVT